MESWQVILADLVVFSYEQLHQNLQTGNFLLLMVFIYNVARSVFQEVEFSFKAWFTH